MARKKREFTCPPKTCPKPADLVPYTELMARVRATFLTRVQENSDGTAKRRRAQAIAGQKKRNRNKGS